MKQENWHRRHAVMLASQLPEETEDALTVLRLATQLVTGFLAVPDEAPKAPPVFSIIQSSKSVDA
ncbi:hypothetical protein IVB27_34470 [Bradyrhizobium sp. 197]|uniref:hypothetical protein n=1 Tax=Bradyrhizobium sp. 197 TaxID=2782663 RepID=UPI001FFBFA82|nr:hypothetical protein [Bradyrhizobium sp. 197]MCK1479707.1 hypothetical protein [Bradyrhizobium sp. 197]